MVLVKKSILPVIFIFLAVLLLGLAVWKTFLARPEGSVSVPVAEPTLIIVPTKTPGEIEIVIKKETKSILITGTAVDPAVLEIKVHDLVQFENQSGTTLTLTSEALPGVPVFKDKSLAVNYDEPGTFTYTLTGLDSPLTGTIVVK